VRIDAGSIDGREGVAQRRTWKAVGEKASLEKEGAAIGLLHAHFRGYGSRARFPHRIGCFLRRLKGDLREPPGKRKGPSLAAAETFSAYGSVRLVTAKGKGGRPYFLLPKGAKKVHEEKRGETAGRKTSVSASEKETNCLRTVATSAPDSPRKKKSEGQKREKGS